MSADEVLTPPDESRPPPPASSGSIHLAQLARGVAGPLEVFAQGIAAAAPSVAVASVPASLFLITRRASIWGAILAAAVVLLVAYVISLQARRTVSVGSLGTYAGNGLGPVAAFSTGWGLFIGYLGFAAGAAFGGVLYLTAFVEKLGLHAGGIPAKLAVLAVVLALMTLAPYRGIKLSARAALVLELASILAITVVFVGTWVRFGWRLDVNQLNFTDFSGSSTFVAAVLAIGAYAGFESVAALGFEARNPHRTISVVVRRTVGLLAVLYLIATYTEVIGFGGPEKLNPDAAPLPVVARNAHVSWVIPLVSLGIGIGMIAFGSAVLNAGSRVLFTLASEGALPRVFGRTHPRHRSPHIGILVIAGITTVLGVVGTVNSVGRLWFETYLGTISTWGYLTAYLLVAIATPLYLRKVKALTPGALAASGLATLALGYVIYSNLVPAPAFPFNILPYIYLGLLAVGLLRYLQLHVKDPARARRIGRLQELSEDEAARVAGLAVPAKLASHPDSA